MTLDRFHGIYPILYAFFDADGRPSRDGIVAQVEAAVRHGAHGVAVLGIATETNKLDALERRTIMEWTAQALDGRLPLAVTIAEPSVHGQVAFARAAHEAGANWVILQPPPVAGLAEIEYLRFFGAVADAAPLAVAIQNAAQFLGIGLSNAGLATLHRNHPNVSLLKGEAPAHVIARLVDDTAGAFRVFNGRGGLELPDCLRAGCVGIIPAPECFDLQVAVYEAFRAGREDEADAHYRAMLPLVTFMTSSIDTFVCYGKRIVARRLGLPDVSDRAPAQRPTPFGLAMMERFVAALPPL
ncbi:MAG TPA: dihydrodipicolinate synthase family protein [Casimicrobiaceae bacterium]|nr:dihydrodipicolinate synthase family protein [Casimicrobiaceae bacterium]